jgi:hypothetical protein
MPLSATCMRRRPSNGNGLVTTATVSTPISLASCATTGAAPVPVPPPMPAVMNTMSEPSSASMMRSRSSSAAWRPTSGFAPAPRPLVTLLPSCSCSLAPQFLIACASVLAVMNSTPSTLLLTMCATALPPPPPTPMTLMVALGAIFSNNSKCAMTVSSWFSYVLLSLPVLPSASSSSSPCLPFEEREWGMRNRERRFRPIPYCRFSIPAVHCRFPLLRTRPDTSPSTC